MTLLDGTQEMPAEASAPSATFRLRFPAVPYQSAASYFAAYADEVAQAWKTIDLTELERAAEILLEAYTGRLRVFSCGNGGSASIANHLVCDHMKGVRAKTDLMPQVTSLSNNVELLTAIANDIGYEEVFTHQLQSQASAGDVLIAISSSGRSANIVGALTWAREHGLRTIAITGFTGGEARKVAEVAIHADCDNYGVIEDLHQAVMHALAQFTRQSRMTAETISATVF
jgi:phosphoheptose isomerase